MLTRAFGANGVAVPIIGQGTGNVPLRAQREEAIRALRAGIEAGMVHIDTAEMYGDGGAEVFVGDAIAELPRESLFLVSKVLPSNATHAGTMRACEQTLRRLRTDYLDCYLLHWRGDVPLGETLGALEQLVHEGKIRTLGVSNFDVADLEEARGLLTRERIACNQVLYHLGERSVEAHEIPYCRAHGIAFVAYTPFGRGAWRDERGARDLHAIADRHGVSAHAVILAFLTRGEDTFAIPKASHIAHVADNARGGTLRLSSEEIATIEHAFPLRPRRGGLPTL
jgi:diketogulonate reductase-like aldo/keto reductase